MLENTTIWDAINSISPSGVTLPIENITNLEGSKACTGTEKVVNVTITNSGGLSIVCAADQTGGGAGGYPTSGFYLYNDTAYYYFNESQLNATIECIP